MRGILVFLNKAYKFRIYPTCQQATLINKTFGCCRFIFNHFLSLWYETYHNTGKGLTYSICSSQLTQLKKELVWLTEVVSISLQSTLKTIPMHVLKTRISFGALVLLVEHITIEMQPKN